MLEASAMDVTNLDTRTTEQRNVGEHDRDEPGSPSALGEGNAGALEEPPQVFTNNLRRRGTGESDEPADRDATGDPSDLPEEEEDDPAPNSSLEAALLGGPGAPSAVVATPQPKLSSPFAAPARGYQAFSGASHTPGSEPRILRSAGSSAASLNLNKHFPATPGGSVGGAQFVENQVVHSLRAELENMAARLTAEKEQSMKSLIKEQRRALEMQVEAKQKERELQGRLKQALMDKRVLEEATESLADMNMKLQKEIEELRAEVSGLQLARESMEEQREADCSMKAALDEEAQALRSEVKQLRESLGTLQVQLQTAEEVKASISEQWTACGECGIDCLFF